MIGYNDFEPPYLKKMRTISVRIDEIGSGAFEDVL